VGKRVHGKKIKRKKAFRERGGSGDSKRVTENLRVLAEKRSRAVMCVEEGKICGCQGGGDRKGLGQGLRKS